MRRILFVALPLLGAFCGTSAPTLREPVDLPLDDIDVAETDGGTQDVQVRARDGGPEGDDVAVSRGPRVEAADAGEPDRSRDGDAGRVDPARAGEAAAAGAADVARAASRAGGVDDTGAETMGQTEGEGAGAGEQEQLGIDLRGD